jgi:hypothetical protein
MEAWRAGTAESSESRDRLQRAGWSLGETFFGQRWQVDGSNGENRLLASGARPIKVVWSK